MPVAKRSFRVVMGQDFRDADGAALADYALSRSSGNWANMLNSARQDK